jgi:hypothetical protein
MRHRSAVADIAAPDSPKRNPRYYLLAFSQKRVRLFHGDLKRLDEVPLGTTVPQSLLEAQKYRGREKQHQVHTISSRTPGGSPGIAHGHGAGSGDSKIEIEEFFRQIDAGLRKRLRDEKLPLFLACVDYLAPIYRKVNSYAHLEDAFLAGNPDRKTARSLHAWASEVMRDRVRQNVYGLARD